MELLAGTAQVGIEVGAAGAIAVMEADNRSFMEADNRSSVYSREPGGMRKSRSSLRAVDAISADGPVLPNEIWAWYAYDWSFSPYWQVADLIMKWFLKRLAEYAQAEGNFNIGMSAGSYPAAVLGVTSAVQVVILLTFSAFGDYGRYRKSLMIMMTYGCCFFLCCCLFCTSGSMWWLAGLLRVLMGCCFVLTNVYYNSYLPLLTSQHPEVLALRGAAAEAREVALSNQISSKGQACGYAGGMSMQIAAFLLLMVCECTPSEAVVCSENEKCTPSEAVVCSEYERLRWFALLIAICGVWWALFSLYTFKNLKVRAGGPFPQDTSMLCLGWKDAGQTLCTIAKLKNTLLFVFAYFIWSDALTTVLNISALIVDDPNAPPTTDSSKMVLLVGATLLALLGVLGFMKIQQAMNLSTKTVIMVQLCVYAVICAACACGALDSAYMVLMALTTFMLGSLQANQRSLYSNLAPVGKEAAMFAFYTITDKGSSLIGAAVTTVVHSNTNSYLGVFWYCFIAYALSAVILFFVDEQAGMRAAGKGE